MKLFFGLLTLLTAIVISLVAAYFSIVGLMALFAAAGVAVAIMGGALEFGKLVAWAWLKLNWSTAPKVHNALLAIPIAALMGITSIGIYGFLSAGHLEQKAPLAGLDVKEKQLEVQIQQKTAENDRLQRRLDQIDQNVAAFLKNDDASRGLSASNRLNSERGSIQKKIEDNNTSINTLNDKLVPLKMESGEVEAKLGPVKYVAALFGWEDAETAVRMVIIVIMVAFDPLAILLLISAMITLREWSEERKKKQPVKVETPVEPPAMEEFIFPPVAKGRGTLVTKLPDSAALGSLSDLDYFKGKLENAITPVEIPVAESEPEPEIELTPDDVVIVPEPIVETIVVHEPIDRENVLSFLEANPDLVGEIATIFRQDIEEELTDREKLLDLLEKNPAIINDMAAIIAAQVIDDSTKNQNSWL